ncbi:TonB-dependent receptor plug domain-containing protein [Sphaerotilus uruguayifluvii]|uniref:Iron complex outermembrane receptor protein n=1 Tax=Sphaerotilus uruguayifluvii TaxID=2735897 RepID=A0ABX2G2C5_9BURK|nr:TonB-dependent receptor [Leptothrix sp. C29]NRT55432.1 iron complex outermembrane receptor protein [Leptothrix sp. C29]
MSRNTTPTRRNLRPVRQAARLLLPVLAAPVLAQEAPAPAAPPSPPQATLERVEIRASRPDESRERRQSTAAKTVIGREELDRNGDATVTEVLKRQPGVTLDGRPGRGGNPRLRGLGSGYTQILINGERMPMGMSLDALTPEQVERIEITRGPTAETGAQAVAGTINIVLREDVRQRLNDVHLRLGRDDGRWQSDLSWTRAGQIEDLNYNLSMHLGESLSDDSVRLRTVETAQADGALLRDQDRLDEVHGRRRALHAGGRLQWKLGAGESLALMPFVILSESRSSTRRTLVTRAGDADYDHATSEGSSRFSMLRLNGQWQTRLEGGTRLELKAGTTASRSDGSGWRDEFDGTGAQLRRIDDERDGLDRWLSTGGKLSRALVDGQHQLSLGWEIEQGRRDETRTQRQTAADGSVTSLDGDFGDALQAHSRRGALWIQDEWTPAPQWSIQAGLRHERIDSRGSTGGTGTEAINRSRVTSPMLHAVHRLDEDGRQLLRAGLTRSYKAPTLAQLIASGTRASGTNLETNPDRGGNPDLRPELATGLDLAWERHLAQGGVFSVGAFTRRIEDLIRNRIAQENVGGETRWVSRPQNIGRARTTGLELEAKGRAAELAALLGPRAEDAPPLPAVDLRANLSVYRSRVESLSGPDNRLDSQPGWSAGAGADWRVRGLPLTLGASVSFTPGYAVQLDTSRTATVDTRQVIDAYALWTFAPDLKLRVSASNLAARDSVSTTTVDGATTRQTATTWGRSSTAWAVRLEMKL